MRKKPESSRKNKLSYTKDSDGDGVVDAKDCKPFDAKRQGFLHDLSQKILSKKEEFFEKRREKEQSKLEDLKDRLQVKVAGEQVKAEKKQGLILEKQAKIDEINREKAKLNELKEQNRLAKAELDKYTTTGKIKSGVVGFSESVLKGTQQALSSPTAKSLGSGLLSLIEDTPPRKRKAGTTRRTAGSKIRYSVAVVRNGQIIARHPVRTKTDANKLKKKIGEDAVILKE